MAKKVRLDLIGKRFGKLEVIDSDGSDKHGFSMWKVKCDCGIEKSVRGINLKSGSTQSCGCSRSKYAVNDGRPYPNQLMVGDVFGKLVVLSIQMVDEGRHRHYLCLCDCGMYTVVREDNLKNGNTRSCGCMRYEKKSKLDENDDEIW